MITHKHSLSRLSLDIDINTDIDIGIDIDIDVDAYINIWMHMGDLLPACWWLILCAETPLVGRCLWKRGHYWPVSITEHSSSLCLQHVHQNQDHCKSHPKSMRAKFLCLPFLCQKFAGNTCGCRRHPSPENSTVNHLSATCHSECYSTKDVVSEGRIILLIVIQQLRV